jgi:hypothetical protein
VVWGTNGSVSPPCVAPLGMTAVGFWNAVGTAWHPMRMPNGVCADLAYYGCTFSYCLLGGVNSGQDAIWLYNATTHTVTVRPHPRGARGVDATTCVGVSLCIIGDTSHNEVRFLFTTNVAASWHVDDALSRLHLSSDETISALTCWSTAACLIAASSVTYDGGTTTVFLTGTEGVVARQTFDQPSIAGLQCSSRSSCFLITSDLSYSGYWLQEHLYVSSNGGRSWDYKKSVFGKSAMLVSNSGVPGEDAQTDFGCTLLGCVGIGAERGTDGGILLRQRGVAWAPVATKPVMGFVAIACGRWRCAAVSSAIEWDRWYAATFRP